MLAGALDDAKKQKKEGKGGGGSACLPARSEATLHRLLPPRCLRRVGAGIGRAVGSPGATVGAGTGSAVGAGIGDDVGTGVGPTVGSVGAGVGEVEGAGVGVVVGISVGAGVGVNVSTSTESAWALDMLSRRRYTRSAPSSPSRRRLANSWIALVNEPDETADTKSPSMCECTEWPVPWP